ncbi:MAG: cobalt ECF transporter T component CbiQ [Actinomycetota bacterium]
MTPLLDRLAQTGPWRHRAVAEKTLLALGLMALALALPAWPGAALVLAAASTAALAGARIPAGDWLRLHGGPAGFILVAAAAMAIGPDGLDLSTAPALVALRALAAVSCLLLLAATTPAPALVQAARRLGVPAEVAEVALLTWRFLFLLLDVAVAVRTAQDARLGWVGWRRSIRSLGLLIGTLLPSALDRARRLEVGLAARGFDGSLRMVSTAKPASALVLAAVAAGELGLAGAALWLT